MKKKKKLNLFKKYNTRWSVHKPMSEALDATDKRMSDQSN